MKSVSSSGEGHVSRPLHPSGAPLRRMAWLGMLGALLGLPGESAVHAQETGRQEKLSPPEVVSIPLRGASPQALELIRDPKLRQRALEALAVAGVTVEVFQLEQGSPRGSFEPREPSEDSAGGAQKPLSPVISESPAPRGIPGQRAVWLDVSALQVQTPLADGKELLARVVTALQLPMNRHFTAEVLTREELQARARESISLTQSRKELERRQGTLQQLGLLSPEQSLRDKILVEGPRRVDGRYDPRTSRVELAEGLTPAEQASLIARGMVSMLQEEHFDLLARLSRAPDEQTRVARALVLGQGRQISQTLGLEPPSRGDEHTRAAVCGELEGLLRGDTSPYAPGFSVTPEQGLEQLGLSFLEQFQQKYGATAGALVALPVSSEQLLHFEKYEKREQPPSLYAITLLSQVGAQWRALDQTSLGELYTACWLGETPGGPASTGWGNDVLTTFEGASGRSMLAWRTVWDSEQDAKEFAAAARGRLRDRFPDITVSRAIPDGLLLIDEGQAHGVVRLGSEVRIVIGADRPQLEELIEAEW